MRHTRQREVVLEVVRATMEHPTAEWVYRRARRRIRRISLGTVYRNLKQLAGAGLIREIQAGGQALRFDGNVGPHHHVRCVGCGRVNDLVVPLDTRREQAAARAMDFQVLGHHVEVQGLCPACRPGPADRTSEGEDSARQRTHE
jgi:Fur family ferric uptake transcriptional regulator